MASLKDLRNRIASVKATQKITKAMQMVAAAKLRKAQEAAVAARPYAERMEKVLANIGASVAGSESAPALIAGTGKDDVHLLVVFTAERGLAGAFNASIVRKARMDARRLVGEGKTVKLFLVGKKGNDMMRREFEKEIVDRTDFRGVRQFAFSDALGVADKLLKMFDEGVFDVATIYYSRFESVITQVPVAQRVIPVDLGDVEEADTSLHYEYEPDEETILADLLPRNLAVQIFRALLENGASEQGARMTAMDNATRNAGEMIDKLSLSYNRQRQAQITTELIEIISGAESL
ncbi:F0F1 ATP synthase subunit gamma [Afifella marina]|uniref:ATP synthase gamma chain n=1 Tax=Afifella marina DSM 2698 TaxID=1120955 RepID=A0A1G5NPK7_AFIMA|nr:F0F1 ATP synthase subunit gamma [Afifella marina]MBK1624629.1 F0F1 ATP synthase subunit gamma [Afifella marina DSM 2698]MBK1627522.1 F0F1 ATP synthase subunit gamma [Afifella marina]MBK5918580.1 F0F1 ATP synthase subunit gamma [Afifella marina]RAI18519.1 F0F1 ATP synthase subunit gamma [Afifella marina DSM 2698]SCZ38681.1 F-type H+-transporting ATPase subunit gamma [Afifella marina DSM 2698]